MTHARFRPVIHYLRTLALRPHPEERGDAWLLERFAAERDESAFAALVHRHGPMVFAVCRRVLRDAHDAEDCFQAVFLVLARKAASLRNPERLANWLYGVAYRTAVKARSRTARQREHERPLVDVPVSVSDDLVWRDLRPILDEEIHYLPVKYRTAVILCYLEGATNAEAARRLGWTRGTVATRLAWARQRLHVRLTRRGITLPAGGLAALLTQQTAEAGLPALLVRTTIETALLFAVGHTLTAGTMPVVILAKGVLKTMTLTKIQFAALMLLTASAVGVGVGWLARSVPVGDRSEPQRQVLTPPAAPRQEADANAGLKRDISALRKEMADLRKQTKAPPAAEPVVKTPEPLLYQGKPASYWLAALRDRDWNFRAKAVEPLGSLAHVEHSLIPPLIGCLQDEAMQVRELTVEALRGIGPPAQAAILPLLRCGCPVGNIVNALEQIDPKGQRAVSAALDALKEAEPRTQRTAAFVLLAFDKSKIKLCVPGYIEALWERNEGVAGLLSEKGGGYDNVHQIAAWALGQIGPEARAAVPALVRLLRDPSGIGPASVGMIQKAAPYDAVLKRVDPEGKEAIPRLMKALTPKVPGDPKDADGRRQMYSGEWSRVILALAQYGAKAKAAVPILRTIIKITERNGTSPGPLSDLHRDAIETLKKIDPEVPQGEEPNKPAKKSAEK